jgi:signal transduction histidine kinase
MSARRPDKPALTAAPVWSGIGFKLFLSFLCMAAVTVGLLWLIQAGLMRNSNLNARMAAVRAGVTAGIASADGDWTALEESLNITVLSLDPNGNPRTMSQGMPMMGRIVQQCQSMIPDGINDGARLVKSASGGGRIAILGFSAPDGGYLFAVFSVADLDAAAGALRSQLWLITAILLLMALLLSALLSRLFARPIRSVTAAARRLATGQYDIALPVGSRDEIGQLTLALNELCRELQTTDNLRKELIANVSHELRAPLAVIRGYAETVRDVTWPDETKRTEQLSIIAAEAARLSRVVGDILDYSRLQAGAEKLQIAPFAARPVLESIVRRFELDASQRQVKIKLSCPEATIRFDADRFEQVMTNLLGNAVNHADPATEINVAGEWSGNTLRISVANRGETIPAGELGRIWDRFYQAGDEQAGGRLGSGLGLAIVRSILERHGAAYGVTSESRTTSFWFEVALAPSDAREF